MATAAEVLKSENIYLKEDIIGGVPCSVGYIKEFRWSWMATQLNTFIIIGHTDQPVSKTVIADFSKNCFEYALKNHQGWPRGLQSGVASIAILQATVIEDDAVLFCERLTIKHWSAFEVPVLYHPDQKIGVRFKAAPIWGTIFFPYFAKKIDTVLQKLSGGF